MRTGRKNLYTYMMLHRPNVKTVLISQLRSSTLTGTRTWASGRAVRRRVVAQSLCLRVTGQPGTSTKAISKTVRRTEKLERSHSKVASMSVSIRTPSRMGKGCRPGLMADSTLEIGRKTNRTEQASTHGQMDRSTTGSGKMTKSMETGCTLGLMGLNMLASSKTASAMAKAFIHGRPASSTRASGKKTSSTGRVK